MVDEMALTPQQAAVMRGHPTAPGIRDMSPTRLPAGDRTGTRDGVPGVPRYVMPWPRDYHADPGNIRSTNGPKQPGIKYVGELPGREPVASSREKQRLQLIRQAQSGSV